MKSKSIHLRLGCVGVVKTFRCGTLDCPKPIQSVLVRFVSRRPSTGLTRYSLLTSPRTPTSSRVLATARLATTTNSPSKCNGRPSSATTYWLLPIRTTCIASRCSWIRRILSASPAVQPTSLHTTFPVLIWTDVKRGHLQPIPIGTRTGESPRPTTWFLRKGRSQLENRPAMNLDYFVDIFLRWRRRHTLALCLSLEPLVRF